MKAPSFDLLEYLVQNKGKCRSNLANSNLAPLGLEELGGLEGIDLWEDSPEGTRSLREIVARISGVSLDQVLATAGSSEANFLVGLALLERGSKVVVETPYYEPLAKAFQLLGMEVSYLPRRFEEGFRLQIDDEVLAGTDLLVLTNLHNPGGVLMDKETLREVARKAHEEDFLVLVDEVFREAAFDRAPPCALTLDRRFVVTSSPSKFYGLGGLRVGWCLADPGLLRRIRAAKFLGSVVPSVVSEALTVRALEMQEVVRKRNHELLDRNRDLVKEWVEGQKRLEWVEPDCHVSFPRFHGKVEKLARIALEREGVLIAPGRFFGDEDHFRLCFGMATQELEAGLDSLGRALEGA